MSGALASGSAILPFFGERARFAIRSTAITSASGDAGGRTANRTSPENSTDSSAPLSPNTTEPAHTPSGIVGWRAP